MFDLSDLVRQAIEMTKPWWKTFPEREGIAVQLNLDLINGCFVQGKQNELFEVVVNLIKNAAEALPEGGDITVKTSVTGRTVAFRVDDTGVGIPRESLNKVFDPFRTTKGPDGSRHGPCRELWNSHASRRNYLGGKQRGTRLDFHRELAYRQRIL